MPHPLPKIPTGIGGFDEVSHGGLPHQRTTLLKGGPGSGKTVFALQCLVNAVRKRRERGLFVAFEESTRQIAANAATFDWGLPGLTIADTWIHLSYLIRSGERNRALTLIKSRGTSHSNQVRELILGAAGPALADVYTAGGEVLMGTLRWEKEDEERAKTLQRRAEFEHKRRGLQASEADTDARIKALQQDLARQRADPARGNGRGNGKSARGAA